MKASQDKPVSLIASYHEYFGSFYQLRYTEGWVQFIGANFDCV